MLPARTPSRGKTALRTSATGQPVYWSTLPANMISHSTSPVGPSGRKRLTSPIIGHEVIASGVTMRRDSCSRDGLLARRMKVNSSNHQLSGVNCTNCRHLLATSLISSAIQMGVYVRQIRLSCVHVLCISRSSSMVRGSDAVDSSSSGDFIHSWYRFMSAVESMSASDRTSTCSGLVRSESEHMD